MKLKTLLTEKKVTNRDIPEYLDRKEPFIGNSVTAYEDSANGYTVKSYDTVIYDEKNGLNTTKYSATTSKIQNMIKSAYGSSIKTYEG